MKAIQQAFPWGEEKVLGRAGGTELTNSNQWEVEPDVGRVADGVPGRVDRLKQLGNAVVPQVVEIIGRAIIEATQCT